MEVTEREQEFLRFARVVVRMARNLDRIMNGPLLKELGLGSKDLFVLRAVASGAGHPSQVAERLSMAAPSVSRSLDKLTEMKLIAREIDDNDRRRFRLSITEEGEKVSRQARELIAAVLAAAYRDAPLEQVERATDALEPLAEMMSAGRVTQDA